MPFVEYRSKNSLKFFLHRCFEVKCSSDANAFPSGKLSKSQSFTGHRKIQFALLPGQNGKKLLLFESGDQFLHAVAGVCQPCSGLHIVLRHSVKGQHGIRNFLCAVLILRGVVRAIRASDPLFLCAKDSHNLAVNLGNFAGSFHAHHALAVLRSPEVVIERDRGFRDFHCSSFPLRGSSGKSEDRKRAA